MYRKQTYLNKISIITAKTKHIDATPEVIRIPNYEEQVEFAKHKINLEDISIYKQQVEEIKHIEETLKRNVF